jgi:hypothetical protein
VEVIDESRFKISFDEKRRLGCLQYYESSEKKGVFYVSYADDNILVKYRIEGDRIDKEHIVKLITLENELGWFCPCPRTGHVYIYMPKLNQILCYKRP